MDYLLAEILGHVLCVDLLHLSQADRVIHLRDCRSRVGGHGRVLRWGAEELLLGGVQPRPARLLRTRAAAARPLPTLHSGDCGGGTYNWRDSFLLKMLYQICKLQFYMTLSFNYTNKLHYSMWFKKYFIPSKSYIKYITVQYIIIKSVFTAGYLCTSNALMKGKKKTKGSLWLNMMRLMSTRVCQSKP